MNCVLILGTAHKGRYSEKVARFLERRIKERGDWDIDFLDVAELTRQATGSVIERDAELKSILKNADAYIIVSPEYNRGYPGELKLFLDSFYREYTARPVGFCGVSSGSIGGARAVEQLKLVSLDLNFIPIHTHLYVGRVQDMVDADGVFDSTSIDSDVDAFLNELSMYAHHLVPLRDALMGE